MNQARGARTRNAIIADMTMPVTSVPMKPLSAADIGVTDGSLARMISIASGKMLVNASDATIDSDGDGMDNRGEYLSGTNPTNSASVLKLTFPLPQTLQFIAESNITYNVQMATNVVGIWETISNIAPVGTQRTIDVSAPSTNSQRYIRVVVP